MSAAWFLGGIAAVAIGGYILLFNSLVAAHHKVKQAWSGIDVQLKRRYDLIPKLVETVKAYAGFEKDLLTRVTEARAGAMRARDGSVEARGQAEGALSSSIGSFRALAEAYPDLKANRSYLELQKELSETEDQIAAARRIYNGNVNELNVKVDSFPVNLVASIHKFQHAVLFEIDTGERAPADLKFDRSLGSE